MQWLIRRREQVNAPRCIHAFALGTFDCDGQPLAWCEGCAHWLCSRCYAQHVGVRAVARQCPPLKTWRDELHGQRGA